MNLRKLLRESVGGILIAAMLGGSLTLTICDAMGMAVPVMAAALPGITTALVCALMALGMWPLIITLALLALAGGAAVYFRLPAYTDIVALIKALLTDGSIKDCAGTIAGILGVLITTMAFLMTRIRAGVYPALTLLILVAMGTWMFEKKLNIYYIAPALVAVAMLFASSARERTSFNAALPVALASVAIALLMTPVMGAVSAPLQQFGQHVRTTIADYLMFSEARTLYSVQSDGYQQHSGQLGGDANPSDFPIMQVKTDRPLLLRGTIKREYTGNIWVDNAVNSRNLFSSPLRRSLRKQVFGAELPDAETLKSAPEGLFSDVDVDVTFLSRGTSTLFTPHRITGLTVGRDMIPYFNSAGEVFITRTVRKNDSYSFTASVPDTYSENMNSFLSRAASAAHSGVPEAYLQLPDTLSTDVYDLTYSIIRGRATPYEKARAIEDYLKNNLHYTLAPGPTPDGRDFVSYFLLESRRGYCTYFASAMGVMARIAGIPSRYIEGYLVKPAESGAAMVIGKNAHAWVELYFDGFGWLSFDPTPEEPDKLPPLPTPKALPPSSTPQPTPLPTPEPSDESLPEDTPQPSVPPEAPENPNNPDDAPTPDDNGTLRRLITALLILLLIIIALLLIAIRLLISTPRHIIRRVHNAPDKIMVYYRAILTVLEMQGQAPMSGETPAAFAERLTAAKLAAPSFKEFTDIVVRSRYAGIAVTLDMCSAGAAAYEAAVRSLHIAERLRWYRRRITHGIGSIKQIP